MSNPLAHANYQSSHNHYQVNDVAMSSSVASLHFGEVSKGCKNSEDWPDSGGGCAFSPSGDNGLSDGFHVYAVEWEPRRFRWQVLDASPGHARSRNYCQLTCHIFHSAVTEWRHSGATEGDFTAKRDAGVAGIWLHRIV